MTTGEFGDHATRTLYAATADEWRSTGCSRSGRRSSCQGPDTALAGRDEPVSVPSEHFVNGNPLQPPFPEGIRRAVFAMGCFWGAERKFWEAEGVYTTAVGYAGGETPNPSVSRGVLRRDRPHRGCPRRLRRERDDVRRDAAHLLGEPRSRPRECARGTTLAASTARPFTGRARRSANRPSARRSPTQRCCATSGYGEITTEVRSEPPFYYAEDYHQQYLAKNPGGYCGIGGTGVSCPTSLLAPAE